MKHGRKPTARERRAVRRRQAQLEARDPRAARLLKEWRDFWHTDFFDINDLWSFRLEVP